MFLDRTKQRIGVQLAERSPTPSRLVAIHKLITDAQRDCFTEACTSCKSNTNLSTHCKLSKYSPYLDKTGTMRVGGRISRAEIPHHLKHPIILPKDHPVTKLILHNIHHKSLHGGRHITHGIVRDSGYVITGGLGSIRSLVENCFLCRILRAPFQQQYMSDLPVDRLEEIPPFSNVGLDVLGPFQFHDGRNTRCSSSSKKMWGLLITCLCSRGVHIEPLTQMDTSRFKNALRRFFALRGTCKKI